jgi:hypothetical protein
MIRILAAILSLSLAAPVLAANAQQERMKACNQEASDKKGAERKAFMKECLKAKAAEEKKTQQEKMTDCNKQAEGKKGAERKSFMKQCLSAK